MTSGDRGPDPSELPAGRAAKHAIVTEWLLAEDVKYIEKSGPYAAAMLWGTVEAAKEIHVLINRVVNFGVVEGRASGLKIERALVVRRAQRKRDYLRRIGIVDRARPNRKARVRPVHLDSLEALSPTGGTDQLRGEELIRDLGAVDPELHAIDAALIRAAKNFLRTEPSPRREVFESYYLDERSYDEITRIFDLSYGSARRMVSDTLQRLRAHLGVE